MIDPALWANASLPDAGSLATFSARLHINTALSIAANLLALYLIAFHSSKTIASYKWCLFNVTLMFLLFDLHVTVVFQMLPLYPIPVVCTIGPARFLPTYFSTVVQLIIATLLFGCCIGALFTAFFFRLLSVYNRVGIMRKPWFIACLILMHLTATAPCAFAFVKAFQDDDESREAFSKLSQGGVLEYPCMVRRSSLVGIYTMSGEAVFWTTALFLLPVATFRKLKKEQKRISVSAYRAQRALLVSLVVQVLLPLVTMAIPIMVLALCVFMKASDTRGVIQAAIQLLTLHSFFNAFALVALTKPYRETVKQWLRLGGNRLRVFATTSSVHPAGPYSTPSTTVTAVQNVFVRRNTWF